MHDEPWPQHSLGAATEYYVVAQGWGFLYAGVDFGPNFNI